MAAEDAKATAADAPDGVDANEGTEPDYKALWEAEKAHKREWEKRAKANKAAADELTKAQEAGKTAEERIAALERQVADAERAQERSRLAAKVAADTGVPADLIVGDTEEEMAEWAGRMRAALSPKPAPKVDKAGSFAKDAKPGDDLLEFTKKLLNN